MEDFFDTHLFDFAGTTITVAKAVTFGIILLLAFILSQILERATARAFRIRNVTDEGTIGVAQRLVHYLVLLIGLATLIIMMTIITILIHST